MLGIKTLMQRLDDDEAYIWSKQGIRWKPSLNSVFSTTKWKASKKLDNRTAMVQDDKNNIYIVGNMRGGNIPEFGQVMLPEKDDEFIAFKAFTPAGDFNNPRRFIDEKTGRKVTEYYEHPEIASARSLRAAIAKGDYTTDKGKYVDPMLRVKYDNLPNGGPSLAPSRISKRQNLALLQEIAEFKKRAFYSEWKNRKRLKIWSKMKWPRT